MVARMTAAEVSMSNPTIGELQLSNGLRLANCNPAFLWSDDSRFLAVPQWRFLFGLQLRQRIVILEPREGRGYITPPLGWFLQPVQFSDGSLIVAIEPTRAAPKEVRYVLPQALEGLRRFDLKAATQ